MSRNMFQYRDTRYLDGAVNGRLENPAVEAAKIQKVETREITDSDHDLRWIVG